MVFANPIFLLSARWEKEPRARFARAGFPILRCVPRQHHGNLQKCSINSRREKFVNFKISRNFFRAITFFNMAALGNLKRSVFRLRGSRKNRISSREVFSRKRAWLLGRAKNDRNLKRVFDEQCRETGAARRLFFRRSSREESTPRGGHR